MASPQSAQLERSQPMSTSCDRQPRVLGRRGALADQATGSDDATRKRCAARLQGYDVRVYALQLLYDARQFVAALYIPL